MVAAMSSAAELRLSVVSVWEIGIKAAKGKIGLASTPRQAAEVFVRMGGAILPLTLDAAATIVTDPPPTNDLFDRMLLAQCEVEGLRLLTVDEKLESHRLAWRP